VTCWGISKENLNLRNLNKRSKEKPTIHKEVKRDLGNKWKSKLSKRKKMFFKLLNKASRNITDTLKINRLNKMCAEAVFLFREILENLHQGDLFSEIWAAPETTSAQ
jgi:hypothetical protein